MNLIQPPASPPAFDMGAIARELHGPFTAILKRISAIEQAMREAQERMDAAGIPAPGALTSPTPARPRAPGAANPKAPALPAEIRVPDEVPAQIAHAIRLHASLEANRRNAAGEIQVSALRYAQVVANRIAAAWLDPARRANAEKELADSLAATTPAPAPDPSDDLSFDLPVLGEDDSGSASDGDEDETDVNKIFN